MDVQQQRVEFVTAAKRGSQPFRSLCEEFGISRPTGYLRLHRYEQQGLRGIGAGDAALTSEKILGACLPQAGPTLSGFACPLQAGKRGSALLLPTRIPPPPFE